MPLWCRDAPHCRMESWTALKIWGPRLLATSGLGEIGLAACDRPEAARDAVRMRLFTMTGDKYLGIYVRM